MKKSILALAVVAFVQGFALHASAATLTFESLASADGTVGFSRTYTEQGFKLDDITTTSDYGFSVWGTSNPFFSGSTALINDNDTGTTLLTQVGGGAFNMTSIDLTVMYPGLTEDGANVTFGGVKTDGTLVSQTFHVTDTGTQTFSFSGFTNLSSVTWSNDPMYHQFDNIYVTAVPEPESYAMLLAGIGLMGVIARRRRLG